MKAALSWIKAYVPDLECTDSVFQDGMTLSGSKVEGFEALDKHLSNIVAGRILSVDKHPDADKLTVCQVDVGSEQLQIVTGAKNVAPGDIVPVVRHGGSVSAGPGKEEAVSIKEGKLRGVISQGMFCSLEELGQEAAMYPDAPEDGIYILPGDVAPGADVPGLMGLRDRVFEFEITNNRVDCYSVLGLAREAAATFGKRFVPPAIPPSQRGGDCEKYIQVKVEDTRLCPRFCARVCRNVRLGPSPLWMQRRLAAAGIRPINNIVDITNYVMEELGQPMHAYDHGKISGGRIVVRRSEGELFQTLDGQERATDRDMLMIWDGEKPIGIAGIMGGEEGKITQDVHTVVFEAATFAGANIRKSAKRLGLRTDASGKFEKGLHPVTAGLAVDRACQLVEELGIGQAVAGRVEDGEPLPEGRLVEFAPEAMNRLLGLELTEAQMLDLLRPLGIELDGGRLSIPYFRQDLESVADIAEEVARFFGYDRIPSTLPRGTFVRGGKDGAQNLAARAGSMARHRGYSQAMCYSFESPKVFDKLRLPAGDGARMAVRIANPLGEDFSIMRTLPVNGLLISLALNYNRRNGEAALFELANIYLPKEWPLEQLPEERMQLTLASYGKGDFFALKGDVEEVLSGVGLMEDLEFVPSAHSFLHPGRQAFIQCKGQTLGYLGEVHPRTAGAYDLGAKAYLAVLDLPAVEPLTRSKRKYSPLARFPAVQRDLSLVVPKTLRAGEVEARIRRQGGRLLESLRLFDIYEGDQVACGRKSRAYRLSFRDRERTLEEADVAGQMAKILHGLEELGITLRKN